MSDIVRVLRLVEYIGLREDVEAQINKSIHGTREWCGVQVRATTLGEFPEIMEREDAYRVSANREEENQEDNFKAEEGADTISAKEGNQLHSRYSAHPGCGR